MKRSSACGCSDWNRRQLLTQAAQAGRGLPQIEPGMPLASRHGPVQAQLLARSAGLALAVYGASKLPLGAFEGGIAEAAAGPAQPVLVSVFLDGGIDPLSVIAPTGSARYRKLRPSLGVREGKGAAFEAGWQWAAEAGGLSQLYREGKLAVLPSVGYKHPDQSHFTCRARARPPSRARRPSRARLPAHRCRLAPNKGRGRDNGTRISRPSKRQAARQGVRPRPSALARRRPRHPELSQGAAKESSAQLIFIRNARPDNHGSRPS
jgi:hypothetical protein